MQKKRKLFSINKKISLVIFLAILFCSVSISGFSYVSYRSNLIGEKGENAKILADSVSTYVNGNQFRELSELNEVDDKNDFFNTMKQEFTAIRDKTGVFYLYTMIKADETNYKYIVSVNEPGADELPFGTTDLITLFGDEPMQAMTTGKSYATNIWDGGRYGFLVSGFSPILDDAGKICGVVGVDINVDDILLLVNNFRNNIIIVLLIIGLISILISSWYFRRTIIKPIEKISTTASKLSEGNLDVSFNITSNDELGVLSDNFLNFVNMVGDLVKDFNKMSYEQDAGNFESFIDSNHFKGSFKEIAEGVNTTVKGYIDVVMEALKCVEQFGEGNFHITFSKYSAEKALAFKTMNALEQLQKRLIQVNNLIHMQVKSATLGRLSDRADVSIVSGEWKKILMGLNNVLDAIVAPINEAAEVLSQVSCGNFNRKVEGDYQGDFLIIKNSINNTVTNISSYIDEISNILSAVSQDDLSRSINREYVGDFTNIKEAINSIINKFNMVISEILSAAGQVAAGAQMISENSMVLAQGTTEQASSVEELNATIITINQNTAQNAENAKKAEDLSAASGNNAAKGNQDMHNMLVSMDGIKESSNSISKIIKVIDDIAFQTNLLALNAAVEAARAGEHGKGFAVVAEEVRSLSGRSQNAARETAAMIEESIARVNEGAIIANTTANTLRTIVSDATKIADIISNIAHSSDEQAIAVSQITEGISRVAEVVQSNSSNSEEAASASQQLSGQADVMKNLVSVFKLKKL